MLEYKFSSLGLTAPVCLDGTCYASGGFGVVVALDENSGGIKWYYSTDPGGELDNVLNENEIPIVHNDRVYIFSEEGFISDLPPYVHILDKLSRWRTTFVSRRRAGRPQSGIRQWPPVFSRARYLALRRYGPKRGADEHRCQYRRNPLAQQFL